VPVVGQLIVQLALNDVPGQRLWGGAALSPSRRRTEQNATSGGPGDIGQLFVGEEEPGPVGVATHDLVNAWAGRQSGSDQIGDIRDGG